LLSAKPNGYSQEIFFYGFYFDNEVMCVQQIRNIGVIEGVEPVKAKEREILFSECF